MEDNEEPLTDHDEEIFFCTKSFLSYFGRTLGGRGSKVLIDIVSAKNYAKNISYIKGIKNLEILLM